MQKWSKNDNPKEGVCCYFEAFYSVLPIHLSSNIMTQPTASICIWSRHTSIMRHSSHIRRGQVLRSTQGENVLPIWKLKSKSLKKHVWRVLGVKRSKVSMNSTKCEKCGKSICKNEARMTTQKREFVVTSKLSTASFRFICLAISWHNPQPVSASEAATQMSSAIAPK